MVQKPIRPPHNVVDFAFYRQGRDIGKAAPISVRVCRYCGAKLAEGEREDECSSTFNVETSCPHVGPRVFCVD